MPETPSCPHRHRRLIAKDQDAEYIECLDCGAVLEKEELAEPTGFDESLSDA
jgi:transcription initiation factor TFIIIB Brf1 subunit/transcription initiation factor TFIIB